MKKLISALIVMILLCPSALAYKDQRTIKGFQSSQLILRGDMKLYKVTFVATSNTATFTMYDCLTIGEGSNTNVKTEGAEATSGNGKCYDFSDDPIEFSTGAYIVISNMNVILEYSY